MIQFTVLLIHLIHLITPTTSTPAPAPTLRSKFLPSCLPTRPYCIRPRVEECRDALNTMTRTDPGYPLDLGRKEVVGDGPRSYVVPRVWSSLPINCLVKIDVIDPKAVEVVPSLKALTAPAELIIRKCLLEGTQCGGSILVGPRKVLKLTLSYYTDVTGGDDGVLRVGRNGTDMAYTEA